MPSFPLTALSPPSPYFPLPKRLPKDVHLLPKSSSSLNRSLHSQKHRSTLSLFAFDARKSEPEACDSHEAVDVVLKLYSALKSNNTRALSEILADECRCVCNFLSFFQAFQGKKQVLEFFSHLIRIFGNNIEIEVKPTLQNGMYVGVEWKFESDKIQVPLGKGLSLHLCQTYRGKAVIRNIEMFMEPQLYFEPISLKMIVTLTMVMGKIGSFMVCKSENKPEGILSIVLALLALALLALPIILFFLRVIL